MRIGLLLALSLSTTVAFAAPGQKGGAKQIAQQTGSKKYVTVKGSDGAAWVDRSKLPKNARDRILVLRQAMEHEITGEQDFKGDADTPAFEIVSHGPELREVTRGNGALSLVAAEHKAAVYKVKSSELTGGKLKTTLLLPVSGHVGLAEAQKYAKQNVFEVKVNGKLTRIPARGFVTEQDMDLELKPGRNVITAEPYTNALGGYVEGRTIYIDVEP
jgi:hypothetical protein